MHNIPFLSLHALALSLCVALYFVRMFGITAGYHRYFSHRSYKTSRVFQFVMAWLGCSAMQKGPLWWAGHHRHHHRYSDADGDVHSPYRPSLWWSHLGWVLSPKYAHTAWPSVRDWDRYPELRLLNRFHWVPGLCLAVLCYVVAGWSGLAWGWVVSTVLLYHATFTVNSVCHRFGGRRYATKDDSRNNLAVALLTLGEGWHNNHHHYQASARQGFVWWQVDFSYYMLRLLGLVGLVWNIRVPPPHKIRTQPG